MLAEDTRGAVMVIAVFMAAIAIACLYFLTGIGDAILAQERMQDAADAAAFSSAVIHARGMNLLALINIIMASLLAILVLLSMLSSIFGLGSQILKFGSFFVPALAAGVVPLRTAAKLAKDAETTAKPKVEQLLKAAQKMQAPLRRAIPVIASVNAADLAKNHYGPVVTVGTTFPILAGLPTVDGKFDKVCSEAGELAGKLALLPITAALDELRTLPAGGTVAGAVSSVLKKFARRTGTTYAKFYCGNGPKPEPPTHTVDIPHPELRTEHEQRCDDGDEESCMRHAEEIQRVREAYDVSSGTCSLGTQGENERCEMMRRNARTECDPNRTRKMSSVRWREVKKTRTFRVAGEGTRRRVIEDPVEIDHATAVIKTAKTTSIQYPIGCYVRAMQTFAPQSPFTDWEHDAAQPLCETKVEAPPISDFRGDEPISFEVHEYTDILTCFEKKKIKAEVGDMQATAAMKKATPQEMCNCAAQGEEMFQIRSIVLGDPETYTARASKGILVGSHGASVEESRLSELGELGGKFAAAQAEYYFDDGSALPAEWLWSMKWKARMRRLSFGRSRWECPERTNTCSKEALGRGTQALGEAAQERLDGLRRLLGDGSDSLIVH